MTRRGMVAMAVVLGGLFLTAGLAPLVLTTLPNPVPVKVNDPAAQVEGVYVGTTSTVYHVFPFAEASPDFPTDALVTSPAAEVWVKYGALSTLTDYAILSYPTGREIPSARTADTPKVLEVRPLSALPPGDYYAQVPRDSLLGGFDYVYFRVAPSTGATTAP